MEALGQVEDDDLSFYDDDDVAESPQGLNGDGDDSDGVINVTLQGNCGRTQELESGLTLRLT
jgi:hypothetical protein